MSEDAIKAVNKAGDDYYKILGLSKSATDDELKKAYRKLALRLHPDKCKEDGAEEAFKKVGEAFSVLSDADKRNTYDQFGASGLSRGGGGGGGGGINPEDIFEAFFGGGGFGPMGPMGGGGMGGQTFVRGGNGTTFRMSSGGGGANVFHFNMGGGGMGGGGMGGHGPGLQQRRAAAQRKKQQQEEEEEEAPAAPELPAWISKMQHGATVLGPIMPLVVLMVIFMGFMLFAQLMQLLLSKGHFILPICWIAEGRTKWLLLSAVAVGSMFGVI